MTVYKAFLIGYDSVKERSIGFGRRSEVLLILLYIKNFILKL